MVVSVLINSIYSVCYIACMHLYKGQETNYDIERQFEDVIIFQYHNIVKTFTIFDKSWHSVDNGKCLFYFTNTNIKRRYPNVKFKCRINRED